MEQQNGSDSIVAAVEALAPVKKKRRATKPVKCPTCPLMCRDNSTLIRHMLVHTEGKAFHCSVEGCDHGTNSPSNLARHMKVHDGGRMPKKHNVSSLRHFFLYLGYAMLQSLNKIGLSLVGRRT
jgi:uncharacterized Zn-finger protein